MTGIYMRVHECRGLTQLSIETGTVEESGTGFRIGGPKFDGSSVLVAEYKLSERDAREIKAYLDQVEA